MRKNKLVALLFFSITLFISTSCKRTFYCECRQGGIVVGVTPIRTLGRFGAKDVCDSYQLQNNINGANQACSIK